MFACGRAGGDTPFEAMRIKSLHIENFRGLVDERVEFDASMTVLAGGNGGGKSSLLEAVSVMLSWLPAGISGGSQRPLKIRTSDITRGRDFTRLSMVLGQRGSKDISLVLVKRARRTSGGGESDMGEAEKYASDMRVLLDSPDGAKVSIPLFVHYGTNRNASGVCAPMPDGNTDRTSVYEKAFCAGVNFGKFSRWLCGALTERQAQMEAAAKLPLRAANRRRDEINFRFGAVAAVRRALSDFDETFGAFSARNGTLFFDKKNVPASALSDGEKTVVALIADIALRMAVANPSMKDPLSTSAIILIDELDMHLHPDWQASIAERLPRIFTDAQFVISSHSPSIMSLAKNLYRFRNDGESTRLERVDSAFGRNPSDLLSSVLNASRETETAAKIARMYSLIDERKFSAAQKIIDELNRQIPDDPEIVRAEYIVRALAPRPETRQ